MRNVVMCAVPGMLVQLCVQLTALVESNPNLHILIARCALQEEDALWLAKNQPVPNENVTYIDLEEVSYEKLVEALPEGVDHALFLDDLTLVCTEIAPFYDAIAWSEPIVLWHELEMSQTAEGIHRYDYGEPWLDTLHTEESLIWWQYAKKTPFYVPLMELYVRDTYTTRQMTRALYTEYLEHDRLNEEYARYKACFDQLTHK